MMESEKKKRIESAQGTQEVQKGESKAAEQSQPFI
jgi:hypothetical protein